MTLLEWLIIIVAIAAVVWVDRVAKRYAEQGHEPATPSEKRLARAFTFSRRDFLKFAGAGGIGAGLGLLYGASKTRPSRFLLSQPAMPEDYTPGIATWYNTVCNQCSAGCGVMVRNREGRAKKIEGNPAHPVSQGGTCARGQAGVHVLYNPDRVKNPLVRQGDGFVDAGWGEALDRVAGALREAGDGGTVFLSGTVRGHLDALFARFAADAGATYLQYDFTRPDALYEANRRLFGMDRLPHYDIANADLVVSFGADFLGTWVSPVRHGTDYGHMRQGRDGRRGRLVAVESRMSFSGANADDWLPAKSGSEALVALAIARELVRSGRYGGDDASAWADALARYTPEFAARHSGLDAGRIERLAVEFAATENSLAFGDGDDPGALVAYNLVNYLAGRIGRPGGVVLNPPPAVGETDTNRRADRARMRGLVDDARTGRIKVLIVHDTNPAFTLPEATGFADALRGIPLVVYIGNFVDETAEFADVVLPTHSYLERWGDDAPEPGVGYPVASVMQPVVQTLYDTRAPGDIVLALARRLELDLPWRDSREHLRETWQALHARHGDGGSFDGFWKGVLQAGVFELPGTRAEQRIERPSASLLDEFDFTPRAADGEFTLHTYLAPSLLDGRGANLPWLQELPDPITAVVYGTTVEINPDTAARLGVRDGDVVEVGTAHGSMRAPAIIYPAIRPDTVAIAIGQGHTSYGRYARGCGVNPLKMLDPDAVAAAGVSVRRTGERARVIRTSGVPRELGRNILGGSQ